MLARYDHLEGVPQDWRTWDVNVASPRALSETLREDWDKAMLFRDLATLRKDIPLFGSVDELRWTGTTEAFPALAARFDAAVVRGKEPVCEGVVRRGRFSYRGRRWLRLTRQCLNLPGNEATWQMMQKSSC